MQHPRPTPKRRADICVVGAGYVGLTAAACFAALGHRVRCVEHDEDRLATLRRGESPIYEPGLDALIEEGMSSGRLSFTGAIDDAVPDADVAFLCVGTPPRADGHPDLRQLAAAAGQVAAAATGDLVVAVKSTVPPGTCEAMQLLSEEAAGPGVRISVASNPEFLRESQAVSDFFHPDRVVVGADDEATGSSVASLYPSEWPMLRCDRRSSELIKYASNTFLAVKISFANEVAGLCEHVGADAASVLAGVGMDQRIGPSFLGHGPGFGGSCLTKDVSGLVATGAALGFSTPVAQAALDINTWARGRVVDQLATSLGSLAGTRIAVLGLAFKPGTDDVRDSPAVTIVERLLARGASVSTFDPVADPAAIRHLKQPDAYRAVSDADAVVIATAWPEFALLDVVRLHSAMRGRVVVDTVGVLDPAAAARV
ncbi:MAG TPA: UDP-glucose/GDP-mannose dehydrogenase family protein, partial [Acidimicrobiales bacterium]|nr:UDP-glucose/GDP-mannose dehydrogenase family protein [Acidimicrobiales bacterium]